MKISLALLLPFALLSGGCPFFVENPGPPPPDDCSSPGSLDGVQTMQIGTLERAGGQEVFVPWDDDAVVDITLGAQGGDMLGVALRFLGSDVPGCVEQRMVVRRGQETLASTRYPVRTYEQPDGARATRTIWMIFDGERPWQGDEIELTLQLGSIEMQRRLLVEAPRPERVRVIGGLPLSAGVTEYLELTLDRYVAEPMVVTIASSDPGVVRPVEPSLRIERQTDSGLFLAELEAVAPGSAIISVSAHARTIETEVTVE